MMKLLLSLILTLLLLTGSALAQTATLQKPAAAPAIQAQKPALKAEPPRKFQRYKINYGRNRVKTVRSAPPTLGLDYRRVAPLPESGHNYLQKYYQNH